MTLTEFLLARIAEDEAIAQAGTHGRWDPARVLAECEAKRQIIDRAFIEAAEVDGEFGCLHSAEEIRSGADLEKNCYGPRTANRFLKPLAAVYSDHPGYDPEWEVS